MIFVYVCSTWRSTWGIFEIKTRFEAWITRNDVNCLLLCHLCYLKTILAYLCSQRTPNVQVMYFIIDWSTNSLFVQNSGWKRDPFQIMIFVINCSTLGIDELKTRFDTWTTWNNVNSVSLVHLYDLITLLAYLCLQRTPNVQVKYFMFDSSIYILFVLNSAWKRDSLLKMIFV
jgi:hypothetical protein